MKKGQFEIWLVNLNPAKDTEPGKIRPAVMIQTNLLNQLDHPLILFCPFTTQLSTEENILRVRVGREGTGLEEISEILVDQISALDNRRFLEKLEKLSPVKAFELSKKIGAVLDFENLYF